MLLTRSAQRHTLLCRMKFLEEFDTFVSVEYIAMETFRNWAKAFGKYPQFWSFAEH